MTRCKWQAFDGGYKITGELNALTVPRVWRRSEGCFAGIKSCRIDLSGVQHSDSAGLALLIDLMKMAKRHEVMVEFVNIPDQMLAIARVSGLDKSLPIR